MYLVDTNVWLERLLEQTKAAEVARFLDRTPSEHLYITDFAFHSIAVIMTHSKRTEALLSFVKDAFVDGAVSVLHLEPEETEQIAGIMSRFNLDFDDAYQYVAAEKHDLVIVSFDTDFDRTERKRKTPGEAEQPG